MNIWGNELQEPYVDRADRGNIHIRPIHYGTTLLGSPLHAYLPLKWDNTRTLVMAGIHGEEPETSSILSYGLRSIKPEYLSCAVIITANPDGMSHGTRGNDNNVDLNRNFPTSNWRRGITKTRWAINLPEDVKLTCGYMPASEPEVSSLINFILGHKIDQIVNLHAPLACIDYEQGEPWRIVNVLGERLKLPIVNDIGYTCPGSMDKWATNNKIRFVTVEIEANISLSKIREKYGPVIQDLLLGKL